MTAWLCLVGAILAEVAATASLRGAATGAWRWYFAVVPGYLLAFVLLSAALNFGLGIGVAYGVWAASGVAITAVLSKFIFKEPLTLIMGAGIALIVGGVLLVEFGAAR